MMNSAFLASLELDRQNVLAPSRSAAAPVDRTEEEDHETELLARDLTTDFPLHSMSELRRAVLSAADKVHHKDPSHILDYARDRLKDGLLS